MAIIMLVGRFDRYFCATLKIAEGLVHGAVVFSRGKNVLYVYTFLLFALDGVHQPEQCE